ncbi:alcohol dehydrogenase catalytic domain-containing protein [Novosphingobium sp. FSY-8]|uniref:Alcohol dehydrogenase catalytic domain-containing protein n=1 Tax=Novosphingobium ovatum TaxID=1908523 RepID=A0ABW9XDW1_9SPHN|nr:NAD(P)-dependent alcohol dehydrogenase [Novosphingobium ovatum]NBC36716.1 alcohol dehydrogenase catalytic domain-containing protein [Novosphingobium ovatum]
MTTTVTAAVCRSTDAPFTLETLTLDAPRADEVLVKIHGSGICHTDLAVRDRQLPTPLPIVLGHEGAGVVEAVGADVTHVKVGDRVLMSFNSCGTCPCCHDHSPTYCYNFFPHNFMGARADGSPTLHAGDEVVHGNFFGQSSFATHALATARNVVKIPDSAAHLPLHMLSPLGCGMMTGAGAVLRAMQVQAGMPIAIFGAGAVGLAAVMAAKIAGANPIIAVDLHENRLALARELGATHTFNGREDPIAQIAALCPQGLAYAFDNTGLASIIEGVFPLIAPKGILGIVGASAPDAMLSFNESSLMGGGKRVIGILGGDSDLFGFLPELIEHHLAGRFPYDKLIRAFRFDDINAAIHAGESGEVVKPVLIMAEG